MSRNKKRREARLRTEIQHLRAQLDAKGIPPTAGDQTLEQSAPQQVSPRPSQSGTRTTMTSVQIRGEMYAGPLPHPELLARYNEIVPGAADRIITEAHGQTQHRQVLEKTHLKHEIGRSYAGLGAGLVVAIFAIQKSVEIIKAGFPVGGSVLMGGTLVALVSVFVYGRRRQEKERTQKMQLVLQGASQAQAKRQK